MRLVVFVMIMMAMCGHGFAQRVYPYESAEYTRNVLGPQKATAHKFRLWLERNQPDSAMRYLEQAYVRRNPGLRKKVVDAAAHLNKIRPGCTLPKNGFDNEPTHSTNVLVYTYAIASKPVFSMHLSFRWNNKDGGIVAMILMNEKQVAAYMKSTRCIAVPLGKADSTGVR